MKEKFNRTETESVKAEIIVAVLDFIQDGKTEHKTNSIQLLKSFAKFHKVPLNKKTIVPDNSKFLRQFILNDKGYQFSIINLYNSLAYAIKQDLR